MTPEREFNAATVDAAVEEAASKLGMPADEISYEVTDPGSSGFMGIGARDARILVTVDETVERTEATLPEPELASGHDHVDDTITQDEPEGDVDLEAAPEELLDDARKYMETVVEALDLADSRLDIYDAGEFVAVDVATEEAGLFIGQKGETIDALQYLLNVAVYKNRPFAKRIILDSEGYRQRRIEALQGMAHRSARRAVREQRAVELPPMSPAERRVVHMFLTDNQRVTTESEGVGENRRVHISPT
ncbi:MAG: Jag N-terminal domain-containing protein [Rubrobacter sp.]|nr:Jag N-terminal domain-containing protein [Rubrobacter sp.]